MRLIDFELISRYRENGCEWTDRFCILKQEHSVRLHRLSLSLHSLHPLHFERTEGESNLNSIKTKGFSTSTQLICCWNFNKIIILNTICTTQCTLCLLRWAWWISNVPKKMLICINFLCRYHFRWHGINKQISPTRTQAVLDHVRWMRRQRYQPCTYAITQPK